MDINWKDLIDYSEKLFKIVAVIVGAFWVYFNWVRGRTFVPRLQLEMSGRLINWEEGRALLVTMHVKNVGSSIAQLRKKGTGLKVVALQVDNAALEIANPSEEETTAFPVLETEIVDETDTLAERTIKNIEPGTAINEQKLIVVNTSKYNAFRLELRVFAFGGNLFGRKLPDRHWTAIAIAMKGLLPSGQEGDSE